MIMESEGLSKLKYRAIIPEEIWYIYNFDSSLIKIAIEF